MVINMFCHIFCMSLISSTSSTDPLRPCKDPWIVIVWLIISKLNAACLAIKTVTSLLSREDYRLLYLSYVYAVMNYGIIFYEHMREMVLWLLLFCRCSGRWSLTTMCLEVAWSNGLEVYMGSLPPKLMLIISLVYNG